MVPGRLRAQRPPSAVRLTPRWPARLTWAWRIPVRVLGVALVLAALFSACGGDAGVSTGSSTTTTTGPETPVTIGIICSTREDAAQTVVDAARAGDAAAAQRCGSAAAVSALTGARRPDASWQFGGCGGPDPGVPVCTYRMSSGTVSLTLAGTEAAGWKVETVTGP